MAQSVTFKEQRVPKDRSLIEYFYEHRNEHPEWIVEKDDLKFSLKIGGSGVPYSLVIKSSVDGRVIAAIPENQPFWIELSDDQARKAIDKMVDAFVSDGLVVISTK